MYTLTFLLGWYSCWPDTPAQTNKDSTGRRVETYISRSEGQLTGPQWHSWIGGNFQMTATHLHCCTVGALSVTSAAVQLCCALGWHARSHMYGSFMQSLYSGCLYSFKFWSCWAQGQESAVTAPSNHSIIGLDYSQYSSTHLPRGHTPGCGYMGRLKVPVTK